MRSLLLLFVASFALAQTELPTPVLGSFAAECVIPVESPVNFGPGFFEIPADEIIRFNVPSEIRMVHAHFDAVQPEQLPEGFDLTILHYEVNIRTIEGVLVNQFLLTGDGAISQHIAVVEPVFDATLGPVTPAQPDDILQGAVTAVYVDADGVESRAEELFYPPQHMNLCCPNSLPSPKGQPVLDTQISWDSNPALGAVEIDGGDFFIQGTNADGEHAEWAYFCHEGNFMSCFIIPDGFSDPTLNRFQEVGGVAMFTDNDTGEEVEFECVFREEGNAQGDDRTKELSGTFKRLDELQAALAAVPDVPVPGIGIAKAECRMTLDFPFEFKADPTLTQVDAAHAAGTDPFLWPADVSITGINILKQANRFHSHWGIPQLDANSPLTLTGFEVTASQSGVILSQETVASDVNDIHIIIDAADPEGDVVATQVVALYTDDAGTAVRSEAARWPDATAACCPGNHPKPIQPLNLAHTELESEIDGGSYSVTTVDGDTFTYFCINGQYHACQVIPEGFTDDLNERYQPIGGVATFQDELTRIPRMFVCVLSATGDGPTLPGEVDPLMSGRYFPLHEGIDEDAIPDADAEAGVTAAATNSSLVFFGIVVGLLVIIAIAAFVVQHRRSRTKPATEQEMHSTTYAQMRA